MHMVHRKKNHTVWENTRQVQARELSKWAGNMNTREEGGKNDSLEPGEPGGPNVNVF